MNKLCRICSGTGLYDIYSRIPFYLHSSPHEFNQWTKTIDVLVTDITGCNISKDDGLPQKICSVCISYLKHASIFRQQAIDNVKNIKAAKELKTTKQMGNESPIAVANTEKFFKSNVMVANSNINIEAYEHMKHELDLFFGDNNIPEDDDDEDGDDDDDDDDVNHNNEENDDDDVEQRILNGHVLAAGKADAVKNAIHNFFNYSERTFEEDDLSKFDGIGISEPDDHKERKCYACKRIFLLNDSFDEHMKECIQAKLFSFITDCHQLAIIKKHKAISAQEFIRRMIFSVKSIVKSLAMCYRVLSRPTAVSATPTAHTTTTTTLNNMLENNDTVITMDKCVPKQLYNDMDNIMRPPPELTARPPARLMAVPAATTLRPPVAGMMMSTVPQTVVHFPKIPNFVAKCPLCKQIFDSIMALEAHNQQLHNHRRGACGDGSDETPTSVSSSGNVSSIGSKLSAPINGTNALLDLLNSDDYATEGIVDVLRLHQRSPNVLNIQLSKDYCSRRPQ